MMERHDLEALKKTLDCRDLAGRWGRKIHRDGKIRCPSPTHDDQHPSCHVYANGFKCYGCGWRGDALDFVQALEGCTLIEAAEKLGAPPLSKPTNAEGWAQRKRFDLGALAKHWGVQVTRHKGRVALVYPTMLGRDRAKFLDGEKPKFDWKGEPGSVAGLVYGIDHLLGAGPVYLVNGEGSVWACHDAGVDAVCLCRGEATVPSPEQANALTALGRSIRVVYDRDDTGREGAVKSAGVLREAGVCDVTALELPASLGLGGDVEDLWRRFGDSLSDALSDLPVLAGVDPVQPPEPNPADDPEKHSALWNKGAEEGVIGAVLTRPDAYAFVDDLESTFFYVPAHQTVWRAIQALAGQGKALDEVVVGQQLRTQGATRSRVQIEPGLLAQAARYASAPHVLRDHADIVRNAAIQRAARDAARDVVAGLEASALNEEGRLALVNKAHAQLLDIVTLLTPATRRVGARGSARLSDLHREAFERLEHPERHPDPSTIPFGFRGLDARAQLPDKDLTALAGDPGSGKSALLRQFLDNWSLAGRRPGVILVEDRLEHYRNRQYASATGLPTRVVRDVLDHRTGVTGDQRAAVARANLRALEPGAPEWECYEGAAMYVEQVAMEARKLVMRGCGVIAIETFTRIKKPRWPGASKLEKVEHNLDVLTELGPELGVPVLVTVHLSREHRKQGRQPDMSDLRDTGNWENSARLILIADGQRIVIAKASHDAGGVVPMAFDAPTTTWREAGFRDRGNGVDYGPM